MELQLVGRNLQIVTEAPDGAPDPHKLAVASDLPKAEAEFKAALAAEPTSPESKNNVAAVYALQGRNSEAIELFRQALADSPNYVQALVNLGLVQLHQGDSAGAENNLRQAARISPNSPGANNALAALDTKLGRGEEAVELLQKVTRLSPRSAVAHLNLAGALLAEGFDLPGAQENLTEAIRLNPQLPTAHFQLGRLLNDSGQREAALKELRAAHAIDADDPDLLYLLAQLERQSGAIDTSIQLLDHLVALQPQNANAQYLLGRNLLLLNKTADAITHFQLAVAADPNNVNALYNLAQTLSRAGKPDAAVYMRRFQDLKQGQARDDRVKNLGSYALEAANAHDWKTAIADLKEAIDLCVGCDSVEDLHRGLGLIYILAGETELGRRELETALKIKPNDTDARKALDSLSTKKPDPN